MVITCGTRLGRYEIRGIIGAGGMGEVFRARDEGIGRDVAIKVLKPSLAADAERLERFHQEARAAGSVGHPNLITIYDIGFEEGSPYIVMELLEGETLRQKLAGRPPDLETTLIWLADVAEGIAAAHSAGVVHRDLKPENVIITSSGLAKVLDFGVAKLAIADPEGDTAVMLTNPGSIVGTVGYMSPEQAMGRAVDHRSDIFSLGSILYEILTGRRAFEGRSAVDTLHKIIHEAPPRSTQKHRRISPELQRIVRKCLAKEAAERYQSAKDLAIDLRNAVSELDDRPGKRRTSPQEAEPSPGRTAVAVLPFANLTPDPENAYLGDGVAEDLLTELAKVHTLKVVSRTSALRFRERQQSVREIAKALHADMLIEGSVRRAGGRVRIAARVVKGRTDEQIWADAFEGDLADIFAMQREVALRVAAALAPELSSAERAKVGRPATTDVEAYRLHLQGRHCLSRMTEHDIQEAIDYFERAAVRDVRYALPHAGMAFAYMVLGDGGGAGAGRLNQRDAHLKAREAIDRALSIDPSLGEAHGVDACLKFMYDFDWEAAESAFKTAIALAPDHALTLDTYGLLLGALERYEEGLAVQRQAHDLDPLEPVIMSDIATTLLRAGRYDEALEQARALLRLEPLFPLGHSTMGWAYIKKGRHEEGLRELDEAVRVSPGNTMLVAQLGEGQAMAGHMEKAREVLEQLTRLGNERYVSPYHRAYVHTGLGEHEQAIDCLERAVDERAGGVYGVKGSFLFTDLRPHPRFIALMKRMNLPTAQA